MPSSSIRSRLKKKLLRRNRGEPEDSSLSQGIPSSLPATLLAALETLRALPLRALGRGYAEGEDSSINQGVILTLTIVLDTTSIWPHDDSTQALASPNQSPHIRVTSISQARTGPNTRSREVFSLELSTNDKTKLATINVNGNHDNPLGQV